MSAELTHFVGRVKRGPNNTFTLTWTQALNPLPASK
jgi:hypothetical protein